MPNVSILNSMPVFIASGCLYSRYNRCDPHGRVSRLNHEAKRSHPVVGTVSKEGTMILPIVSIVLNPTIMPTHWPRLVNFCIIPPPATIEMIPDVREWKPGLATRSS